MAQKAQNMFQNTWFLAGCAIFAALGLVLLIVGATVTNSATSIGVGVVLFVVSGALLGYGIWERKHHIQQQRQRAVT